MARRQPHGESLRYGEAAWGKVRDEYVRVPAEGAASGEAVRRRDPGEAPVYAADVCADGAWEGG